MSRQAILDTAKYLRNVRPIDPEEVAEYVEGGAHPAVVRQTLRENALSLGLYEREDGTFVPASEEPISPTFDGVRTMPDRYLSCLEDLLVERFGPGWADGESGAALREEIRRLKERYYRQHPVEYSYETALGYALYHLPDYYAATGYALDELGSRDLLPSTLRVLDVGAGVGGPALGLADYAEGALVEYHAVEPSAAADVLEALLAATPRNFHPTIHRTTAEAFEPEVALRADGQRDSDESRDGYDLILFANVLSELAEPTAVLKRYLTHLVSGGAALALAPADKNTATGLREIEHEVVAESEYTVFAPTLRLWPDREPTDHCWSFDRKPDLAVPELQRRLDEGRRAEGERGERDAATGEFVNTDVQYAYSILRRDGQVRVDVTASPERFAPFAASEAHVTDRIDCIAVKLSDSLSDSNPLFLLGDGSQSESHYAVVTRETALNRALSAAEYGDVFVLESVLVLWNADENAYNLVVDEECVVDRVG
ncbi:class I SAM-dependent methyltransferase [Halalkalicoccus sp. NIPERK01]|uniref:methyltransferase n=1 Tax=Halalkalicoccus sp. NIPERK01 TaxID=3053469 RepID=UPI00256F0753|nr:class I SAM-dependent methyltransferase [Halalkalicoccus sp. NIPERK01]MDL5361061.1 class I SAM-dependent methyltransferase [Halalkalicoccus sp. NIPERK01]